MNRRSFIRLAGSTAVVFAAGVGTFAVTREPTKALKPWKTAGIGYDDPRMWALSYAILAPNPHNRQPWMADLREDDVITLRCDLERLLPHTDPFNRQIVIGLGCFLENLRMAAAEAGYLADIKPFPEGEPEDNLDQRPIARIVFRKSNTVRPDPLFRYILERRSNKDSFDTKKSVSEQSLKQLALAADNANGTGWTNDETRVADLRDLSWRALEVEIRTPRTYQESIDLMRIGKAEIEANPDGIDIGGPMLEGLNKMGLMTREGIADPESSEFETGLDMFRPVMASGMAYVWIKTDTNTRIDQLNAGRSWVRLNIKGAELGIGVHPISQALQEYPEMTELYDELHRKLEVDGRVQMLGRIGYGETQAPSPRWPLAKKTSKV